MNSLKGSFHFYEQSGPRLTDQFQKEYGELFSIVGIDLEPIQSETDLKNAVSYAKTYLEKQSHPCSMMIEWLAKIEEKSLTTR